jgi:hypothetical protein
LDAGFGARDEKGRGQDEAVKPLEIHIAAVHGVERSGLDEEFIEHPHLGLSSLSNRDHRGNGAADI